MVSGELLCFYVNLCGGLCKTSAFLQGLFSLSINRIFKRFFNYLLCLIKVFFSAKIFKTSSNLLSHGFLVDRQEVLFRLQLGRTIVESVIELDASIGVKRHFCLTLGSPLIRIVFPSFLSGLVEGPH